MKNTFVKKNSSFLLLVGIVISNATSLLLIGLFLPYAIVFVAIVYAFYVYFLSYRVHADSLLWMEVRLYLIAIAGSTLGNIFLWLACVFIQKSVCLQNGFFAQVYANYYFSLGLLLLAWLFLRLPKIINKKS